MKHHAAAPFIGTNRLPSSYCKPQTIAAMPRSAACGLAPLASHRANELGWDFDEQDIRRLILRSGLGHDELRFARRPKWAPLANPARIAPRRVMVCIGCGWPHRLFVPRRSKRCAEAHPIRNPGAGMTRAR